MDYKRIALFSMLIFGIGCSQSSVNPVTETEYPSPEVATSGLLTISDNWATLRDVKLHYAQAMIAEEKGDTASMQEEFESALSLLGEIDMSGETSEIFKSEFEAASSKVKKDFQFSLRKLRVLGKETSASTLMEKLEIYEVLTDTFGMAVSVLQEYAKTVQKDIPLEVNSKVYRIIRFFQSEGRKPFELWIQRSGAYREIMEGILEEEGLPVELIYLAMVESGFNPKAYSWAHAVGQWQFISTTGRTYGLNRDWWVDERRDPVKSTYAASRYLRDLYKNLGDWYLAMAAYNAGEGRVKRAVKREMTNDFWELSSLPRQTRNYVPSFIAAMLIGENPGAFGFEVKVDDPITFDEVRVNGSVNLDVLAKAAEVREEEVLSLNPELRRNATPPRKEGYSIRLPAGSGAKFEVNFTKLPAEEKIGIVHHKVKRGESLSSISGRYGVPVQRIIEANSIRNRNWIKAGSVIIVPTRFASAVSVEPGRRTTTAVRNVKSRSGPKNTKVIEYRVRTGDTLGHIAEYFRTTAGRLRAWNGLRYGRHIYPGQKLRVYVPEILDVKQPLLSLADPSMKKVYHRVKARETLAGMAQRYNVTEDEIMLWNGLSRTGLLKGETLELWTTSVGGNAGSEDAGYTVYNVRRGDTLWEIAKWHRVSLSELISWNPWTSNETLKPGDNIRIYAE